MVDHFLQEHVNVKLFRTPLTPSRFAVREQLLRWEEKCHFFGYQSAQQSQCLKDREPADKEGDGSGADCKEDCTRWYTQ